MKKILVIFLGLFNNILISAQATFINEITIESVTPGIIRDPFFLISPELITTEANKVSIAIPALGAVDVLEITQDSSLQQRGFSILDINGIGTKIKTNKRFCLISNGESFYSINQRDRIFWAKNINSLSPEIYTLNDEVILGYKKVVDNPHSERLVISKLNIINGQEKSHHSYRRDLTIDSIYSFRTLLGFNDRSLLVHFAYGSQFGTSGLLKISADDEIKEQKIISDKNIRFWDSIILDNEENIIVGGQIINHDVMFDNERDGFIAKFDSELNLLWAKKLVADNFTIEGIRLRATENGDIIFVYNTLGDLPVIIGNLDKDGNLNWANGNSTFDPHISISNSSIYYFSNRKYFSDGTSEPAYMLSKSDIKGEFENCPQFNSCLSLFDLEIPFTEWNWKKDTSESLTNIDVAIDTLQFRFTDHCGTPPPPTPFFTFPDTICQNECLTPDSLFNRLAHAVEWTITGNDILFENQDTSFNYCFEEPGKYQIEQEIWLLGCSEFFTREVVVLPDSLGDLLGDDRLICKDTIAVLEPNTTRPIRSFVWRDGTDSLNRVISESGTYAVAVTDGFCSARDEVNIRFFEEEYIGNVLELPDDSSICSQLLPIVIAPQSDFTSDFFINGNTNARSSFEINSAGSYQISTKIEECEFSETFNLSIEPCEIDIYIPSSFSPNNDGINDVLEPLGNDFIGQKLQVFDRWGGLLFETKESPFAWDGSDAEEGVYVLTFSYLNLKNQQEELVSGDVLVVR